MSNFNQCTKASPDGICLRLDQEHTDALLTNLGVPKMDIHNKDIYDKFNQLLEELKKLIKNPEE